MARAGQDYQKWMPRNIEKVKKRMTVFVNSQLKPQLVSALEKVAYELVKAIDENRFDIPIDTSNLKDSTGVAIFADGAVKSYLPTKNATKLQHSGFHGRNEYGIDGSLYLQQTINDSFSTFSEEGLVWFVVYSAVPYAFYIEDYTRFFTATKQEMLDLIIKGLKPIAPDAALQVANL